MAESSLILIVIYYLYIWIGQKGSPFCFLPHLGLALSGHSRGDDAPIGRSVQSHQVRQDAGLLLRPRVREVRLHVALAQHRLG